jgi:hypothetical protein
MSEQSTTLLPWLTVVPCALLADVNASVTLVWDDLDALWRIAEVGVRAQRILVTGPH